MSSHNQCTFTGRLGADVEVRTMSGGGEVASFRIAVSDTWKDKESGARRERTDWIPVVIFNEPLIRVAKAYLRKGSHVLVQGAWQGRKWADRDGNERHTVEVVLQRFRGELVLLDSKPKDAGQPEQAADLDDDSSIPF